MTKKGSDDFADARVLEYLEKGSGVQYLPFGPRTKSAQRLEARGRLIILDDNPYQGVMPVILTTHVVILWKEVKELRKKYDKTRIFVTEFLGLAQEQDTEND